MLMLMTEICNSLRNYFAPANKKEDLSYIHNGEFTIENGTIQGVDFLLPNQYFRITGSVLNDGVYRNTPDDMSCLESETFKGAIWEMAVPKSFINLCNEIQKFNVKVDELSLTDKGYASESFGGYSYSLNSNAPVYMQSWEKRIKSSLNNYRRLSIL